MSKLKVVSVSLLGFLLTLSLAIFGLAFTINMTALNADFVTSRLDALDIPSLMEEVEYGELAEDNPELVELIKEVVIENEAEMKVRMGEAIHTVYDYLKGRSQELDLAQTLKDTVLDPDFLISIVEGADLSPLTRELLVEIASEADLPYGLSIEPHLDDIALELEPWLKEQASIAIPAVCDYALGQSQSIDIVISLEPIKESLKDRLRQDFLSSPPPELDGLSPAELGQAFDTLFEEYSQDIGLALEIDEESIGSEVPADVADSLSEAETTLEESREYVGYFTLGYSLLVVFILLLTAGIVLIYREVKGASRALAGIFLTFGVFNLIAVLVARALIKPQLAQLDIPSSFQEWITQSVSSSLTPMLVLAIVMLVVGAILLAVSIIYSRRQARMKAGYPYSSSQEDEPRP